MLLAPVLLAAPALADLWTLDPGIAAIGDVDAVLEWQGRPLLGAVVLDRQGQEHRFVIRLEADGRLTELLPDWQSAEGVPAVLYDAGGTLLAGGPFVVSDQRTGEQYTGAATWDGQQWSPIARRPVVWEPYTQNIPTGARTLLSDGERLWIGGAFASIDGVPGTHNVAILEDGEFRAAGTGIPRIVRCLFIHDGVVYAGSVGALNEPESVSLWSWDGQQWRAEATYADLAGVWDMVDHEGELLIGGIDLWTRESPLKRRDASGAWVPATPWNDRFAQILALASYQGDLVAGGLWTPAQGMPAGKLARWDGETWRELGLPISSPGGIEALDVRDRRLWLAGDIAYGDRAGLALWVDRSEFSRPAAAAAGDGTWRFSWTADVAPDPASLRVGVLAGPQRLRFADGDPRVTVATLPTIDGRVEFDVTVAGVACRGWNEVAWAAEFGHYGCLQKSPLQTWQPEPCGAPTAAGPIAVAPNPFNPATTLRARLGTPGPVTLEILDLRGRRVVTLLDAWHPAGELAVRWDGRDAAGRPVAAGSYRARLRTGGKVHVARLVLVK
jgi:hypothetical protein